MGATATWSRRTVGRILKKRSQLPGQRSPRARRPYRFARIAPDEARRCIEIGREWIRLIRSTEDAVVAASGGAARPKKQAFEVPPTGISQARRILPGTK